MDFYKYNNNQFDEKELEKYIKEIQSHFPNVEVTLDNVNDCSLVLTERQNCRNCPGLHSCKNQVKGFMTDMVEDKFTSIPCRFKKEIIEKNSKDSLIKTLYMPQSIKEYTFENYNLECESRQKIYSYVQNFIINYGKEPVKGLYISGTFSIGKTYTLACIANELSKAGISSLLIYFPDLVSDIKQALNDQRFTSVVNMLKEIDVLMLDDFGSENMTPWLRDEILGPVLNYRALEHKPVFVSSNLSIAEIKTHIMIDKFKSSEIKAERILERLKTVSITISMDDSQKYKR